MEVHLQPTEAVVVTVEATGILRDLVANPLGGNPFGVLGRLFTAFSTGLEGFQVHKS